MDKEDRKDSTVSSSPGLTIDKAAFLLLRVKRVFRKKKQQRKEKRLVECLTIIQYVNGFDGSFVDGVVSCQI